MWHVERDEDGMITSWLPTEIDGLPLHPLVVHLVVVLVPVAAFTVLVSAIWPAARERLGRITPALALSAVISVPIAESSGESLMEEAQVSAQTATHAELAEWLLPWVAGLAVCSVAVHMLGLRARGGNGIAGLPRRLVSAALIVGAVVFSVGSTVQVVRIGDSGARSVWTDAAAVQFARNEVVR
ncbi:DUF2231 domain-containing protein [Saccharopolyspora mangrovi]|uniref:DUF2231 domain-containing protein n=1 Tax=Saccharopolyspora mangrovi TaxID=3082379 RepID=A0ABU6AFD7_9PSEU|nr:DUF2231 domain-containing protein [Saccharopolyspora sp. S2-29]MEB3370109.1 DUF2231 domain-containing protein [Saccharopolyspora sp. S2-29]